MQGTHFRISRTTSPGQITVSPRLSIPSSSRRYCMSRVHCSQAGEDPRRWKGFGKSRIWRSPYAGGAREAISISF